MGAVAIGRNEGPRLERCLTSLVGAGLGPSTVYVDSDSTDGSPELAWALGVEVLALDLSKPFTAARARNAGADRVAVIAPAVEYIQFVDADCEMAPDWIERALAVMDARPDAAVVCGRRRERHPDASIYNRLMDLEWDTPIGDAKYCGGDALIRVAALREVNGYDGTLIAGEEPDLCLRLRAKGWKIVRIDAEMTLHDAAMTHASQWWRRSTRNGYAFAEGAFRHGTPPERHWVREARSNWFWGMGLPVAALGGALPTLGLSLGLLGAYAALYWKVSAAERRRGRSTSDAQLFAASCVLSKFPQAWGQLKFTADKLAGKRPHLIEYK